MVIACIHARTAGGTEDLKVLFPDPHQTNTEQMMRSYLRRLAHEALDQRMEKYEALKTAKQISEYQKDMRQFFIQQLGGFFERTPLNARIVESKRYGNYRLEKILYESLPRFHVSALLYLPITEPPYPAVLVPCGHNEDGKAAYQEICIALAQHGIAALCYDPIGQGERKQLLNEHGHGLYRATSEHMIAGVAPILLGRNLATYMVWDGIRGIDYLVSRPDIDSNRIGCTGNSGGGNRTAYLMALDERVVSAAPSCFITTTIRKNESPGPGDAEQNIHAQIAYGMDHPDYLLMRAPSPTLVLSATQDFVPIEGAWEAFRQAKRIYSRLGHSERVDLVEADDEHGFSLDLRQGALRWMRRWLLNKDEAVTEPDFPVEPPEVLQCTPKGQVLFMPGARSIFDLNIQGEQELAKQRKRLSQDLSKKQIRFKIREITGIRRLNQFPKPRVENRGSLDRNQYKIDKLVLRWESGIDLPALHFQPEDPSEDYYLYLHGGGKEVDASPGGPIEQLVQRGHEVLAVDLRGCGETRTTPWRYTGTTNLTGDNTAEFFIAYMLDKSFLGMRTEDILVCAQFLENEKHDSGSNGVHVIAVSEAGPPALHAVALEPGLFASLNLRRSLISWSSVVQTPVTKGALINVVHGALRFYDLPDLISLLGAKVRITINEPVDAQNEIVISSNDERRFP